MRVNHVARPTPYDNRRTAIRRNCRPRGNRLLSSTLLAKSRVVAINTPTHSSSPNSIHHKKKNGNIKLPLCFFSFSMTLCLSSVKKRKTKILLPMKAGPHSPTLRANPCPEVTDLFCRLPLPTLSYRLEASHLGDLMRL